MSIAVPCCLRETSGETAMAYLTKHNVTRLKRDIRAGLTSARIACVCWDAVNGRLSVKLPVREAQGLPRHGGAESRKSCAARGAANPG